jgi:hypothetical protein
MENRKARNNCGAFFTAEQAKRIERPADKKNEA